MKQRIQLNFECSNSERPCKFVPEIGNLEPTKVEVLSCITRWGHRCEGYPGYIFFYYDINIILNNDLRIKF